VAAEFDTLSGAEKLATTRAFAEGNYELALKPEGKIIEKIVIFTESPFLKEAKFLTYFNSWHVNTKDSTIGDSILFETGEEYDADLVRFSELSLQSGPFRSLVVILPVKRPGQSDDKIDILVVTRDTWSLRLDSEFEFTGGSLNSLDLAFSENNLFGFNKIARITFSRDPYSFETGLTYQDPRLFGSGLQLTLASSLIFTNQEGKFSGYRAGFKLKRPFYSLYEKYSYSFSLDISDKPKVSFEGGNIRLFEVEGREDLGVVQRKFQNFELAGKAKFTRSLGVLVKHNLSLGYGLNIFRSDFHESFPDNPELKQEFRDRVMPLAEIESFLFGGYDFFTNRFITGYDLNTYELAEILRLGPMFNMQFDVGLGPKLLGDYTFLRPAFGFGFRLNPIKDFFWETTLLLSARFQGEIVDNAVSFGTTLFSPQFFKLFRLVLAGNAGMRVDDRHNTKFALGGESGLRGFLMSQFLGSQFFRINAEVRSASWPVWISRVGGVLFYDAGDAFDDTSRAQVRQSIGLGLRILLMQFNRQVIRIDYGFPLDQPITNVLSGLSVGFGQAF